MVDVTGYMTKEFNETEGLTVQNVDTKKTYTITKVDEVMVSSGFRAGQKAIVMELDGKWSYWPNKTSITTLAEKWGTNTDKWTNKKIKFTVEKVMVRGQKKDAIFAEVA